MGRDLGLKKAALAAFFVEGLKGPLEKASASKNEGMFAGCSPAPFVEKPLFPPGASCWGGAKATGTMWACRMVEDAANGFRKVVASRAHFQGKLGRA